uniref:Uncharacterized protein n=1 Tax=Neospora caninum (strain Liverpool) TaxID=572307 RepID=F0JB30_NEOCL|nr:hypothetical protein NCLIV_069530 [Neospora caninum Liverpool]CEL71296.1 TPA: hypothetical protein BN1204_069530 [Neospora caninum Liverpool]
MPYSAIALRRHLNYQPLRVANTKTDEQEDTRLEWDRSRLDAAKRRSNNITDAILETQGAKPFSVAIRQLLRTLLNADFTLAAHSHLVSEYENRNAADHGGGQSEGDAAPPSRGSDSGDKDEERPAAAPVGQGEEPKPGSGSDGPAQETPASKAIAELEADAARSWERIGIYGHGSWRFRKALLEAAVEVAQGTLDKARDEVKDMTAKKGLSWLEDSFYQRLFGVDIIRLVGQVLERQPELLQYIDPHSDLLLLLASLEVQSTPAGGQSGQDDDDPSGGGADQAQGTPGPSDPIQQAFNMVHDATGGLGENTPHALDDLTSSMFPLLRRQIMGTCSALPYGKMTRGKLDRVLQQAVLTRLVSSYLTFLAEKGSLNLIPHEKRHACLRQQIRAEQALRQALIIIANTPRATADMRRMVDDLTRSLLESQMSALSEALDPGDGNTPLALPVAFNKLETTVSNKVNAAMVEAWLAQHPEVQSGLPRTGVLFFLLPSLQHLREGGGPVVPLSPAQELLPHSLVLYGAGDYVRLSNLIAPYCREEDIPPDLETSLTRFRYLASQRPRLMEPGSQLQRTLALYEAHAAEQWEDLGFFGPLADSAREQLLRRLLPPNDSATQEALEANAEGTFEERMQKQRKAMIKRAVELPLLSDLSDWLQENPEVRDSPYLASDSALMAAISGAASEGHQGVGPRPKASTRSAGPAPKRSKPSAAPQEGSHGHASAAGPDSGVEATTTSQQGPRGGADGDGPGDVPQKTLTPVEAQEPEQDAEEPAPEATDSAHDGVADGGDESEQPGPTSISPEEMEAVEALLSFIPSEAEKEARKSDDDHGGGGVVDQADDDTASPGIYGDGDSQPTTESDGGDDAPSALPEEDDLSDGDQPLQVSVTPEPLDDSGAAAWMHGDGAHYAEESEDVGDPSDGEQPLDLSVKTGPAGDSGIAAWMHGDGAHYAEESEDDDDPSDGEQPLDLSVKTGPAGDSGAIAWMHGDDAFYVDEWEDDDDDPSDSELPLDLSAKTVQAREEDGTSGTGGDGADFADESEEDDDGQSDSELPLDLSAKTLQATHDGGMPGTGGDAGDLADESDGEDDLSDGDLPLDLSVKTRDHLGDTSDEGPMDLGR